MIIVAALCIALIGAGMAQGKPGLNTAGWERFAAEGLPAEMTVSVELDKTAVGAAYVELRAMSTGTSVVSILGTVNGRSRILDTQVVGSDEKRVRLDVTQALSSVDKNATGTIDLKLRVRPLNEEATSSIVYLRSLETESMAKLVSTPPVADLVLLGADTSVPLGPKVFVDKSQPVPAVGPSVKATPNPFNPKVQISLNLPVAGVVKVDVFNLQGRRVRTLFEADHLDAGDHVFTWDGSLADGSRAASGVYLYAIQAGDSLLSGKMALLK